jgi:hypothetical protein
VVVVAMDAFKRFASSKFNSALKSAKGGVISASEKGRVGLRQALEARFVAYCIEQ